MSELKKYHVYGVCLATTPSIEIEAETDEQAIDLADEQDIWPPSICHYCSKEIELGGDIEIAVANESGLLIQSGNSYQDRLESQLQAAKARIKELEQAQEWISTEDTLPEHDNPILLTDSCGWVAVGYYWPYEDSAVERKGKFYKCGDDWHNELFITHWLPLPTTKGE